MSKRIGIALVVLGSVGLPSTATASPMAPSGQVSDGHQVELADPVPPAEPPDQTTVSVGSPAGAPDDPYAPPADARGEGGREREPVETDPQVRSIFEAAERADEAGRAPIPSGRYEPGEEVVELRTEYSKSYATERAGVFRVAAFVEPIHFDPDDSSGELIEIDPTLEESDGTWENQAAPFDVTIDPRRDGLVRLDLGDGAWLSVDLRGRDRNRPGRSVPADESVRPGRVEPAGEDADQTARSAADDAVSPDGVRVDDIVAGSVDMEVVSTPTGFKDSIVLNTPTKRNRFVYDLRVGGLTATVNADTGDIDLAKPDGEIAATIARPIAYDASEMVVPGESIVSGDFELAGGRNGRYRLSVTVDADWLTAPDRQFPVVIDPDVSTAVVGPTKDTFVVEGWTTVYGSTNFLDLGTLPGTSLSERAYLSFNVAPWGGQDIQTATLALAPTDKQDCQLGFSIHTVEGAWSESTLHWNNQPGSTFYASDVPDSGYCEPLFPSLDPHVVFLNETAEALAFSDVVEDWTSQRLPNHGVMLSAVDEATSTAWMRAGSRQATDPTFRPQLGFLYEENTGATLANFSPPGGSVVGETPTIAFDFVDAEGDSGQWAVEVREFTPGQPLATVASGTGTAAAGERVEWTMPPGQMEVGKSYFVYAAAVDEHGMTKGNVLGAGYTWAGPLEVETSIDAAGPSALGSMATMTFTVTNPSPDAVPVTVEATPEPGLIGVVGSAARDGSACSVDCVVTPGSFTASGVAPAEGSVEFSFDLQVVGDDLLCTDRSVDWNATSPLGWTFDPPSGATPVSRCGEGLGLESWWTYENVALGPAGVGQVNVANGNLVVSHTDTPPVQGRGRFAYVLRRTHNSQAPSELLGLGGGGLGDGWTINVTTAGELGGLFSPTGLVISSDVADELIAPGVTMVDRDGTRHVFTPGETSVNLDIGGTLGWLVDGLGSGEGSLLDVLVGLVNDTTSGSLDPASVAVCIDTTYTPPPGVHLSVWRFVAVQVGESCAGAIGNEDAVVLGYATMRPDRVRQVFSITGQLLSMYDPSGNELRYGYDLTGRLETVWEPGVCPDPEADPTCRGLRFSYPDGSTTVVEDPAGRTVTYDHAGGKLTDVTTRTADDTVVESWAYTYDGAGADCGPVDGTMCAVVAPNGTSTRFTHDQTTAGPRIVSFTDRHDPSDPGPTANELTTTLTYESAPLSGSTTASRDGRAVRHDDIDRFGRVGARVEGSPAQLASGSALRATTFTWDRPDAPGEPAISCRPVDDGFDHHLCATSADDGTVDTTDAPAGWVGAGDSVREFTYTPEGEVLTERTQLDGGWLTTTHGYATTYTFPDGSTSEHADTVTGIGTHASSPRPTGALFSITDRVETRTPRGNATTWSIARNPAVSPGTTDPTCASGNTGLVCTQTAPESTVTTYRYDEYGQRVEMRTPKANAEGGGAFEYVYAPDGALDLTGSTSAAGWLTTVVDPDGSFVSFGYDRAGNTVRTWDRNATAGQSAGSFPGPIGSPPAGHTEVRFGSGAATSAFENPWRYQTRSANQLGDTTTWELDEHGNATTIRPPRGVEAGDASFETTVVYDARDQTVATALPEHPTDPTVQDYDGHGNLVAVTDPNGHVRTSVHDAVNRPVEERFTRGPWTDASDTEAAACRESTAADAPTPAGRTLCTTSMTYDGLDRIVATVDPAGAPVWQGFDQAGRATDTWTLRAVDTWLHDQQVYDADNNATHVCPARQQSEEPGTACGPGAHYSSHTTYDGLSRPVATTTFRETIDPATGDLTGGWDTHTTTVGYDADGNVTSTAGPRGVTTTATFDLQARVQTLATPRDATTTIERSRGYDPAGNVIWETEGAAGSPPTKTMSYRYDSAHRLVDSVDAATTLTAADNLETYKTAEGADPRNLRTRRLYDADGNVAAVYGPRAFAGSVTNPNEAWLKRVDIDRNGRTTAMWEPMWHQAYHRHQGGEAYVAECPVTGGSHTPSAVPGVPAYDANIGVCVTRREFDPAGNVIREYSPNATNPAEAGQYLDYIYSDDNHVIETEAPNPAAPAAGEPDRIIAESVTLDPLGRVTDTVDPLGWSVEAVYSPDGLMLETGARAAGAGTFESFATAEFDAGGNTTATHTVVSATQTDTTTTTYLADGLVYQEVTAVTGHNAGEVTWRYRYDPVGNQTQTWSPSAVAGAANNTAGVPTINQFTSDNLLGSTIEPVSADGALRRSTAFTYDPLGRKLTETTDEIVGADPGNVARAGGSKTYTWTNAGLPSFEYGRDGSSVNHAYTADGSRSATYDSDSGVGRYDIHYLNGMVHHTLNVTGSGKAQVLPSKYEWFGRHADGGLQWEVLFTNAGLTAVEYGDYFVYNDARVAVDQYAVGYGHSWSRWSITSDRAGRPVQMTDPQDRRTDYVRNVDGTLASKTLFQSLLVTETPLDRWSYSYDGLDRVTSVSRSGLSVTRDDTFGYDEAGRLDTFNGGEVGYDPNSNRTSLAGTSVTYRADNSIDTIGGTRAHSYAPWGGLVDDGCHSYGYDGRDRLDTQTATGCGGSGTTTFLYDADDRQVRTVDTAPAETRTLRWWTGTDTLLAEEVAGTPADTARYANTPGGQPLAVANGNNAVQLLHSDGRGNTTLATSSLPVAACAVDMDPWGTPRNSTPLDPDSPCTTVGTGTSSTRWFGSASRTPSTGNYRFGSRTYNPATGTWLTPDTAGAQAPVTDLSIGTDPLTANRYTYVNGDPVNLVDPSGHRPCLDQGCDIFVDPKSQEVDPYTYNTWAQNTVRTGLNAAGFGTDLGGNVTNVEFNTHSSKCGVGAPDWADNWATVWNDQGQCQVKGGGCTSTWTGALAVGEWLCDNPDQAARIIGHLENVATVATVVATLGGAGAIASTGLRASLRPIVAGAATGAGGDAAIQLALTGDVDLKQLGAATVVGAATGPSVRPISRTRSGRAGPRASTHPAATFQNVVTGASDDLAANPSLARSVLSPKEFAAAQRSPQIARMQYGNAVERLVARRVAADDALSSQFRHLGGPGRPDFTYIGQGAGRGLNFDVTTNTRASIYSHFNRSGYGPGLIISPYQRPAGFTTF